MPMIQTDSQHYTDIADAIRDQNGTQDTYYPQDMAAAVRAIGNVDDVTVDGVSVVNANKVAVLSTFSGATSQDNGTKGFVPAPTSADRDKALKGDGTWGDAGLVDDVQINGQSVVNNKVASFNNYVEVTQAEYDQLPSTKVTDGILRLLKDGLSDEENLFYPVIYSTDEREIGVWTDGKPLYQRTLSIPLVNNTGAMEATYAHNIANIDKVWCVETPSNRPRPYSGVAYEYGVTANVTNIQVETGMDRHTSTLVVTIRYTKTTDTAGSGTWGTDGVPMKHYLESEHIVGTWIDGSTIYEKTLMKSVQSTNDRIDVTSLNIRLLIYAEGFMIQPSNNQVMINYYVPNANQLNRDWAMMYFNPAVPSLEIRCGETYGQGTFYITIRYVKNY